MKIKEKLRKILNDYHYKIISEDIAVEKLQELM